MNPWLSVHPIPKSNWKQVEHSRSKIALHFSGYNFPILRHFLIHLLLLQTCILSALFISQLNSIERFGVSADIRQCYQLNKFSFGDAMNTAKSTALQCINDKFNEGKTIVDNAINDIRTTIQDVSGAAQMISECRQFTITFPSIAGLVAKVACLSQVIYNEIQCCFKWNWIFSIHAISIAPQGTAEYEKWRHSITDQSEPSCCGRKCSN